MESSELMDLFIIYINFYTNTYMHTHKHKDTIQSLEYAMHEIAYTNLWYTTA